MSVEHYLNNDIIDVPLNFYDIDYFDNDEHVNNNALKNKEKYIIRNGRASPLFNFDSYDSSNDMFNTSKRFCNMNETKLMKSLYKENYLNNDIRDVPFNYHHGPSKTVDLTDLNESDLIKYLYNTHEVKNNKEKFVNNDISDTPLSYYHIDVDNPEKHLNYKENYTSNKDIREIPISYYHIKNFDDNKYINYQR